MTDLKIALLPNLTRSHALSVTDDVCKYLEKYNAEYYFETETAEKICHKIKAVGLPEAELLSLCDVAIAIGGDGSLIHAARKAVKYKKPILGVNAGNLAFMAGIEKNELELLKELIEGNYTIDKRMMLDVTVKNGSCEKTLDCCLNDVVIARGEQIKLVKLNVECDGQQINDYYADGIIISTPTGSTAYSLSAGGPVVDPKIESILLTPICTHSLFARSLIFGNDSVLSVKIPENTSDKIRISCDGDDSVELRPGDCVRVGKSKYYANFIRIKNESFIDVLNSKLAQRRA